MRFLANENFPGPAVAVLQAAGYDVAWVRALKPGASDRDVLDWATREKRVLLTFDKGFGELASRASLPAGCGVVLLRIPMPKPEYAGQRLAELIMSRSDGADHFSVLGPGRVRMRSLR
jgi:hypothetical protein